jgi:hypothetical protein
MLKQNLRVFWKVTLGFSIALLLPSTTGWCQKLSQEKSPVAPREIKKDYNMKTLKIQWQRLLIDDKTCPRCGATEEEVDKAYISLKQSLSPLGIKVVLEKKALERTVFQKNPSQSNLIIIGERTLEYWLKSYTGKSPCCGTCGDTECRTIETQGKTFEIIPAELIIRAGLIAAGQLINTMGSKSCCP